MEITHELKIHIQANATCEDYKNFPGIFESRLNIWTYWVDFEKIKPYQLTPAIENIEIIKQRIKTRGEMTTPQVGDFIQFSEGRRERITYIWEDGQAQAGGGGASFYMSDNGRASYSGSLNEGINTKQLINGGETAPAQFWFFSRNWSGANRGINFECPVKFWQVKAN